MGWEELLESLDDLETKDVYDGYFCSVKDAVVIIILGSLCDLQNVKKIHEWATTEHVRAFLEKEFGIKRIPCSECVNIVVAHRRGNYEIYKDIPRLNFKKSAATRKQERKFCIKRNGGCSRYN